MSHDGAASDRVPAQDPDYDYLPSAQEPGLGAPYHAGGYDPTKAATFADHFNYGAGWTDCEDYCMHREAGWANGSADASDWANPGHQY